MDLDKQQLEEPTTLFEDFYRAQRDRIFRTVFATVGNFHDAEDATAEAFVRAHAQWDSLHTHPSPSAWVVITAKNIFIDAHRKARRFQKKMTVLREPEAVTFIDEGFDAALHAAISQLPMRQREVLVFRIILELTTQETADTLGISVGAVGAHLNRALTSLRKKYTVQAKDLS